MHVDRPDTLNLVVVKQRIVVAGQGASVCLQFDFAVGARTGKGSWY